MRFYIHRDDKRNSFEENYYKAEDSKSRWNLIHKFGVTKKSQRMEKMTVHNANISADNLNNEFLKLKPLNKINFAAEQPKASFRFVNVSPVLVYETINSIKSNSTGPDDIPPKCVKAIAAYIAEPMAHIINESFKTLIFPKQLKYITKTPIAKVEYPESPSQYRPICSANFLLKVLSKLTCQQFYNYLENNSMLHENRGCVTTILKLTEDIHLINRERKMCYTYFARFC